ncbi:MAG TPA: MFS transporter [Terriglobia bacterium]|nr:MFS transporter [Terriglobia bacterium]
MTDSMRRLAVLIAVATVDLMGAAMVFPLIPFYALKLNASPTVVGAVLSSFFVAQLVSAPLWGRVSDRYGRRPALLAGLAALTAGYVIFGFADSIGMLFLARMVQGAGGGTTAVTQAYVADTLPPAERARGLGWLSAGTNVGTMIGPAIGSLASVWGQFGPGILAASLCALNLVGAWLWLPESRKPGALPAARKPVWNGVWTVVRRPQGVVPRLTLIYGAGMFGLSSMSAILSLYLGARFGFTERTVGYVFLYVGVFSVVMRSALVGPIVDRIGEPRSIRVGAAALIAGLIGYPFASNLWALAVVVPLIPVGTALLFPATTALMSRATEKGEVGATMGVAQTFAGISRLVAPITSTTLFQYGGRAAPFYFAATGVALASLLASGLPSFSEDQAA